MIIEMAECEVCKKRVEDRPVHKGWIVSKGTISVSNGRKNGLTGDPITRYAGDGGRERDFCSLKCYTAWIVRL